MTSPYLVHSARRASLMIEPIPPMTIPITEMQPREYKRSEFFMPRTSREAGLEHYEWENRAAPLRSWAKDIGAFICWVAAIVFLAWFAVPVLVEVMK